MRLVPFERTVAADRRIDNLSDLLVAEEGPGILHWLVTGARNYLNGSRDLTGPPRVQAADLAYAESEDQVGRFLAERCVLAPGMRAEQGRLYSSYKEWCELEEAAPVSSRAFAARVRDTVGIASPKEMILSNQRKFYAGLGLHQVRQAS